MSRGAAEDTSPEDANPYAPPTRELCQPAQSGGSEFALEKACGAFVLFALAANFILAAALLLGRLL